MAGALGVLTEELDPAGGLDPAAFGRDGSGPMVGQVVAAGVHAGLVLRTTLDPAGQPFLADHRIDGIPVLPGVMGLEAFAEVAQLLAPGWHVAAVRDVDFRAPVKFYHDEPRELTIRAVVRRAGADLVADCRLEAERVLPGSDEPQRTTHFTGSVLLTAHRPDPERDDSTFDEPGAAVAASSRDVYAVYFHGPAYQVVGSVWRRDGGCVARMADPLPDNHVPAQLPTVTGPRLIELCFQAAGLWEAGRTGRLALPLHVDAVRPLADPATAVAPLHAVVRPAAGGFDCAVVGPGGEVLLRVDGYRSIALPVELSSEARAPLAAALAAGPLAAAVAD